MSGVIDVPQFNLPPQPVMILLDERMAQRIWAGLHEKVAGTQWCAICGKGAPTRMTIKHKKGCAVAELGRRLLPPEASR